MQAGKLGQCGRSNFDKYLSDNICELLAEYLSFVWKIFVGESELRSACKSGSLVRGYLQMIAAVDNANHSTGRDVPRHGFEEKK